MHACITISMRGNEDDEVFRDDDVRRVARPASSHFRVPDGINM